jgi:membrane fusion protein, multidrug efflux system
MPDMQEDQTTPAPEAAQKEPDSQGRKRKPVRPEQDRAKSATGGGLRRLILPIVVLGALGYGGKYVYDWVVEGRYIISTDDAYVGADTAIIAAKVAGHIADVAVTNNQAVKAGDLLVRIDDGDYRLAVEAAKNKIASQDATIARIGQQVEAQGAVIAQAEAQVVSAQAQGQGAEADEQRASLEYDRSQKMAQTNFGSQQRLEQAAADRARTAAALTGSHAALASAKAALEGARANLGVLKAQKSEAEHLRAELVTAEAKAERDLSFTEVRAPFDGVVGNKAVEVGQLAQTGVRLLALVPLDSTYVDANFKETQLGSIKPGQKVDISVDAQDGHSITGEVVSIAPATGSQFSLLPPDNATGNFTKVVQRIPVRISLPASALRSGLLRPGLSVVASVHTRDEASPKPTLLGALGISVGAVNGSARP